jgi:hypothetical protein
MAELEMVDDTMSDSIHDTQHGTMHHSVSHVGPKAERHDNRCYLCLYATETNVLEITNFIIKESHRATPGELATQICAEIAEHDGGTVTHAQVVAHITEHMIHPAVKMACIVRELDDVRRKVHRTMLSVDPETGQLAVDMNNVNAYVRVVREIQQVYRQGDPLKLTFGTVGDAAALSTAK